MSEDNLRFIELPDGRRLYFGAGGDPDGTPLVVFGGTPHSRLQGLSFDAAARKRAIRLITPERPGYGKSDPLPDFTFESVAADTRALLQHLDINTFAVMGISGGLGFAMTLALECGSEICPLLIDVCGQPPLEAELKRRTPAKYSLVYTLASKTPVIARGMMALMVKFTYADMDRPDPKRLRKSMPPADVAVWMNPDLRSLLIRDLKEAFGQGSAAQIRELGLIGAGRALPWADLACQVLVFHGTEDMNVLPCNAEFVAQRTRAEVHLFDGAGHLIPFSHPDMIIDRLMESALAI